MIYTIMAYVRLKCHECEADFGQEARFVDHLVDIHGIEKAKHVDLYVKLFCDNIYPKCHCSQTCQVRLPWAGWKKGFTSRFARGHNARIDSVYLNKERQKEFAAKRTEGLVSGRTQIWNKGLTKESDVRVEKQSDNIKKSLKNWHSSNQSWNKGLTKESDSRILASSSARNEALSSGKIHVWNKGLTKESDERIAKLAKKISTLKQAFDPRRLTPDQLILRVNETKTFELITNLDSYKNKYQRLELRCMKCNSIQSKNLAMLDRGPVCFVCNPKSSQGEREILEYVQSLGIVTISGDRTVIAPRELDIWIPEHNLAIEYNGLYWHSSEMKTDQKYHQQKVTACSSMGVRLLSVYEDEWRDKRQLIEAMIKHRLNLVTNKRYARKLSITQLSNKQAEHFFNSNHLEGHVRASAIYALVDDDNEVCAAMSLRTPFHRQYNDVYEVARSCIAADCVVVGWIGKLTSACLKHAKISGKRGLMTYVDNRVGLGSGYKEAGWKLTKSDTGPRFWWTDFVNRYNRFKVKANNANGVTQVQAAEAAGVVPIWGCSNSLYMIE